MVVILEVIACRFIFVDVSRTFVGGSSTLWFTFFGEEIMFREILCFCKVGILCSICLVRRVFSGEISEEEKFGVKKNVRSKKKKKLCLEKIGFCVMFLIHVFDFCTVYYVCL